MDWIRKSSAFYGAAAPDIESVTNNLLSLDSKFPVMGSAIFVFMIA